MILHKLVLYNLCLYMKKNQPKRIERINKNSKLILIIDIGTLHFKEAIF